MGKEGTFVFGLFESWESQAGPWRLMGLLPCLVRAGWTHTLMSKCPCAAFSV